MLARLFHASKTGVGMTVSAATLGVAISAPIFGALTERLPRKRVIVASLIGISVPTLLAATSTSLAQLIFWRFLQGITVPGVIAVLVTYIGEEWPPERVALIMSFYVSGTALGGFVGRISAGILADRFSWRVSFLVLGTLALAGAGAVALWLPRGRPRTISLHGSTASVLPLPNSRTLSHPAPGRDLRSRIQCTVLAGRRVYLDHVLPRRSAVQSFDHGPEFALLRLSHRTRCNAGCRTADYPCGLARRHQRRHRLLHPGRTAYPWRTPCPW